MHPCIHASMHPCIHASMHQWRAMRKATRIRIYPTTEQAAFL
ncbi:MAG: helix-turn-helix domain-containing protein, partial [Pseudomonadota bacterium]